jgi:hypothetical protein
MAWTEPIYDRVLADITNKTSKGFFNVADWVRINGNTQIVNALINVLKSLNITFDTLTPPTIATIPNIDDVNDFVDNIERIRAASGVPLATGLVALKNDYTSGGITPDYTTVNDWERDLDLLRSYLIKAAYFTPYCGVPSVGQTRFWQVRFRRFPFAAPDNSIRSPRAGVAICGSGLQRQNNFRRYVV